MLAILIRIKRKTICTHIAHLKKIIETFNLMRLRATSHEGRYISSYITATTTHILLAMLKEMKFSERKVKKKVRIKKKDKKGTAEERIRVKSVWKRRQRIKRVHERVRVMF